MQSSRINGAPPTADQIMLCPRIHPVSFRLFKHSVIHELCAREWKRLAPVLLEHFAIRFNRVSLATVTSTGIRPDDKD